MNNPTNLQSPNNVRGFWANDRAAHFPEATEILVKWLAEGKLRRKESIIKGELAVAEEALAEEALAGLFTGVNTGKLLVEVKEVD